MLRANSCEIVREIRRLEASKTIERSDEKYLLDRAPHKKPLTSSQKLVTVDVVKEAVS